jgi:ATP phosphoribosyltransferase
MADLSDVALDFRERKQRNVRIATTFANCARRYLHTQGIHHFNIVQAEGAIEVAPTIGYADIIVDLTQSGTTLRENHLKQLADGTILESQACLIGNKRLLRERADLRETVKTMLEYIDAALVGRQYSQVTVNIAGNGADEVAAKVRENAVTGGLLGPSISPLLARQTPGGNQQWFTVVITVNNGDLLEAVQYLRTIGATHVITIPVKYVFSDHTPSYQRLTALLDG